jgi:hypothetical protein
MQPGYLVLAVPALLLGACDKAKPDDSRTASGEVLAGTIGDGELPLDTVTSQPPLVKAQPKADASDAAEAEDAASLDAEQPEAESAVE